MNDCHLTILKILFHICREAGGCQFLFQGLFNKSENLKHVINTLDIVGHKSQKLRLRNQHLVNFFPGNVHTEGDAVDCMLSQRFNLLSIRFMIDVFEIFFCHRYYSSKIITNTVLLPLFLH